MEGHFGRTERVLWPISVFSGIIMCKFISLGYFLSDLAMILWLFPLLGGKEYVARILLFIYFFTHMYLHFDQVKTIFPVGFYSLPTVPPMMAVMNVFWFWKIFKGMIKSLSKRRRTH